MEKLGTRTSCSCKFAPVTPIGRIILAWLAAGSLWLRADPPAGYYSAAEGKRGAELRVALHAIIRNHHVIPYSSSSPNDTSDALRELDEDPANTNNVLCIYSGKSEAKSTFGISGGWNREHCWCNSYGLDGVEPAYSDLHTLRPEDSNVNSSRQNKLYDVSDTNSLGYKFPAHVEAPLASADSDSWEPPPNVRGDVARAVFYMAVRYTGDHTNEPALFPTDWTGQITSSTNLMGRLSTLLQWHRADPPDARERQRNDRVFTSYQHNRNPFIDHPEWVDPAFAAVLTLARRTGEGGVPPGEGLILSWPAVYTNAVLESAISLATNWTALTNAPRFTGTNWLLALPTNAPPAFYRLRLP